MSMLRGQWLIKNFVRQIQLTRICLSSESFHVQDEEDFQKQVIESKKLFVVDFHAAWCGPCRLLEPRLEKLITKYNRDVNTADGDQYITLAKVDVDKLSDLSSKYKIQAVPTAIKNGKEMTRFTGLVDEDRIETIFDQLNR